MKPTWNWNHHRVSQRLGERSWLRRVWADQSEQGIWEGALKRQELKKSVSDRATEHNEACCKLSYRNNHFFKWRQYFYQRAALGRLDCSLHVFWKSLCGCLCHWFRQKAIPPQQRTANLSTMSAWIKEAVDLLETTLLREQSPTALWHCSPVITDFAKTV